MQSNRTRNSINFLTSPHNSNVKNILEELPVKDRVLVFAKLKLLESVGPKALENTITKRVLYSRIFELRISISSDNKLIIFYLPTKENKITLLNAIIYSKDTDTNGYMQAFYKAVSYMRKFLT